MMQQLQRQLLVLRASPRGGVNARKGFRFSFRAEKWRKVSSFRMQLQPEEEESGCLVNNDTSEWSVWQEMETKTRKTKEIPRRILLEIQISLETFCFVHFPDHPPTTTNSTLLFLIYSIHSRTSLLVGNYRGKEEIVNYFWKFPEGNE